jgi:hypothetical protein
MMSLRGHFGYKIGWLLLYCRVYRNFAFQTTWQLRSKPFGLGIITAAQEII